MNNLTTREHRCFFIRIDGRYQKISFHDIQYIEGCRNYVRIMTNSGSYITLATMRQMEELLPQALFCRIHRSYIVSIDCVTSFDNDSVWLSGNRKIPFGDLYKSKLKERVLIISGELRNAETKERKVEMPDPLLKD